jgi:hypothetical protein
LQRATMQLTIMIISKDNIDYLLLKLYGHSNFHLGIAVTELFSPHFS